MIKNLISPIQAWLLSQNRCVGCGEDLRKGHKQHQKDHDIVTCRCGRMFVYEPKNDVYRRALFDEV